MSALCDTDALLRAQAAEAYETIRLDAHAALIRDILTEATLLAEKYRHVRRHDVPHVTALSGLIEVLWQEVEMVNAAPKGLLDVEEVQPV